jgi:hypothetical protein
MDRIAAWEQWVRTRPRSVQALARHYPLGTVFTLHGQVYWLVGYREPDGLYVSLTNPAEDYAQAVATKIGLCGTCLEFLEVPHG